MATGNGYKFKILDSAGAETSTVVEMSDMFIRKEMFMNAGLWGCGYNIKGQLGNASVQPVSSPIQVGSLTNWRQVSTGFWHTHAVKSDGTLWGCGYNSQGQLGLGNSTASIDIIAQVGLLSNWKQVSCGSNHSLAVKTDGTLWAWGYNPYGSLGNDTRTNYSSPIQVGSLTNWKQVAVGYNANTVMAIKTDGTLWAWGLGGAIGNGSQTSYSSPIQIGSLTNWKQVAVGNAHTIALKTDGTLWSWGSNLSGQLGTNVARTISYSSPVQVGSLTTWKSVSAGYFNSMAIKTDNTLWVWGENANGALGIGNSVNYSSPVQVGSLTNWKQIAGGGYHMAAIKTDGTLWAWGLNTKGQVGNNTITAYSSPVQVGSLTNWKQATCGYAYTMVVSTPDIWS
jgi:alpha-tubulin suppressor-like RCC1 family protein